MSSLRLIRLDKFAVPLVPLPINTGCSPQENRCWASQAKAGAQPISGVPSGLNSTVSEEFAEVHCGVATSG